MATVKQMVNNYSDKIKSPRKINSPVFQKQFLPKFGANSPPVSPIRTTMSTPNLQLGRTVIGKNVQSVKTLVNNFDKSDMSDSQHIIAKEDYREGFMAKLRSFREDQRFTNVKLQVADDDDDESYVMCDAIVLSTCSLLIKERFNEFMITKRDDPLVMKVTDVNMDQLNAIVRYAYSGEVDFGGINCQALRKAATQLRIPILQAFCARAANENFSGEQTDPTYLDLFFAEMSKQYQTFPTDITLSTSAPVCPPEEPSSPGSVAAHRVILAAGNDVLCKKILGDGDEVIECIKMANFNERTIRVGLKLFYTGGLPVPNTLAGYLLKLCKDLEIEDLAAPLIQYMSHHLDAETAVLYYVIAKQYELEDLKNDALEVILGQFNKIFLFEGFLTLSQLDLIEILSDDRLSTGNNHDDIVFDAVVKWLEGNHVPEFNADICKLFDCVRFEFVSHSYLKDKVLYHRYMKYFPQKTYATDALKYQISNIRPTLCLPKPHRTGLTFSALLVFAEPNELLVYKTKDSQKRWHRILKLPLWCDLESVSCVVNGGIIISGGLYKKSCLFYDSKNKDCVQFPNMSVSRGKHGSAYFKDLVFAVGGTNDGSFECLHMGDRVWFTLPSIPDCSSLKHPLVVANETHVYVIGGLNKQGESLKSFYVFDIKQGSWMKHDDSPVPCDATVGGAVLVDGKVCVIINRIETITPEPASPKINGDINVIDDVKDNGIEDNERDPPKTPRKVSEMVENLSNRIDKDEEKKPVKVPMCEGRLIGHLNDKKDKENVSIKIMLVDTTTNKWDDLDEAEVALPDPEQRMSFQPFLYKDKAAILVGNNIMTFDIEGHKWETVHSIPQLPINVRIPSGGKVARIHCAQFPA